MKRLITLTLLLCLMTNGLFAQKKTKKNDAQSRITLELGLPIHAKASQNFPIRLNIEFQRTKNRWGFGAAIGLEYDRYLWGDCNLKYAVGTEVVLKKPISNGGGGSRCIYYCYKEQDLAIKPSVFGFYNFMQKEKLNLFVKVGVAANVFNYRHYGVQKRFVPLLIGLQSYSSWFST